MLKWTGRIFLVLFFVWLGGLHHFATGVEQLTDRGEGGDGIVVLTGSAGRIRAGVELLTAQRGRRMLISGVDRHTSNTALSRENAVDAALLECCIDLDRVAGDTIGNAQETAAWTKHNGFNRLLIVTADFHMPRSFVEMRRTMPEATLIPIPSRPESRQGTRWWQDFSFARNLISEYNKFMISIIWARLSGLKGDLNP